jgi:hypothetical protein
MARKDKYPTSPVEAVHPPERAAQLANVVNDALNRFSGTVDELDKALGLLMLGDYVGWKVLVVIHNKGRSESTKRYSASQSVISSQKKDRLRKGHSATESQRRLATSGRWSVATFPSRISVN